MSESVFAMKNRRTIRAAVNPLDKATIFSIFPRAIREIKHTIQPGVFDIPAGSIENPARLVVGPSSWWKETGENEPLIEIPTSSIQIADSIIKDYANGLLACNMADRKPGLFFIPGDISVAKLKADHKDRFDQAIQAQRNWYMALVQMGDVLWSRTNGNPLSISQDMKLAAQEMNLQDKPWIKDFSTIEMVRCQACGSLRNPDFPVCANCKAIVDTEKAKKLDIKFAG